jgi:hypothetical protein
MSGMEELSYEELADHVVAVALGEKKDKLPTAEKLMAELCMDEPIATASFTSPVEDPDDFEPENAVFYLEKSVDRSRLAEIERGAALTPEERAAVIKAATKRQADSGIFDFVRYYRVTDSRGRSVYFSEVSGDDLGSYGPSSGHEGPLLHLPYKEDTETQLDDGTVVNFCIIE